MHALGAQTEDLTLLRSTCPNVEYRPWGGRIYGPLYDKDPNFASSAANLDMFTGKRMLEIGGPTPGTNIYDLVSGADNVIERNHVQYFAQFSTNGEVDEALIHAGADVDGAPFRPRGEKLGEVIQRHGARLHGIGDESYDVVMSSHNLEHFLDPLEALREWDRVLKVDGLLVLVLPQVLNCTDKHMRPMTMQELLSIRQAATTMDAAEWRRLRDFYFESRALRRRPFVRRSKRGALDPRVIDARTGSCGCSRTSTRTIHGA